MDSSRPEITFECVRSSKGSKVILLRLRGQLTESEVSRLEHTLHSIAIQLPAWVVINLLDSQLLSYGGDFFLGSVFRIVETLVAAQIRTKFCVPAKLQLALATHGIHDLFWDPMRDEAQALLEIDREELKPPAH